MRSKTDKPSLLLVILVLVNPLLLISSCAFYEFDRGRILIDGQDIKDYSQKALRKSIGLVLQEPFLYHGTIASNIRMYHEELTDEEIRQAAALWM